MVINPGRDNASQMLPEPAVNILFINDIIRDLRSRQRRQPPSPKPERLYQIAMDLCIEEGKYEFLLPLLQLRKNQAVSSEQLGRIERLFLELSTKYAHQRDQYSRGYH